MDASRQRLVYYICICYLWWLLWHHLWRTGAFREASLTTQDLIRLLLLLSRMMVHALAIVPTLTVRAEPSSHEMWWWCAACAWLSSGCTWSSICAWVREWGREGRAKETEVINVFAMQFVHLMDGLVRMRDHSVKVMVSHSNMHTICLFVWIAGSFY